jgi:hypothetical protein
MSTFAPVSDSILEAPHTTKGSGQQPESQIAHCVFQRGDYIPAERAPSGPQLVFRAKSRIGRHESVVAIT